VPQHGFDGRRQRGLDGSFAQGLPVPGALMIEAQNSLASTVALFGVPFCRPPVFLPFTI
jgi:hypothetical protein